MRFFCFEIQINSEHPNKVRVYCQMHSRLSFKTFVELFAGEKPCFKSEKIETFKKRIADVFSSIIFALEFFVSFVSNFTNCLCDQQCLD